MKATARNRRNLRAAVPRNQQKKKCFGWQAESSFCVNLQMKTIAVILIRRIGFSQNWLPNIGVVSLRTILVPVYLNMLDLSQIEPNCWVPEVKIPFILPIEKHILMVLWKPFKKKLLCSEVLNRLYMLLLKPSVSNISTSFFTELCLE